MSILGLNAGAQAAPDPRSPYLYQMALAKAKIKTSAGWFDVIAALSMVNSVITMAHLSLRFVVGLGITDLVTSLAQRGGGTPAVVGLVITALAAGMFWGLGRKVKEAQKWALILGMVLYALDAAVILLWQDWLSIAFHGYGLFRMFGAFAAINEFNTAKQDAEAHGVVLDQPQVE